MMSHVDWFAFRCPLPAGGIAALICISVMTIVSCQSFDGYRVHDSVFGYYDRELHFTSSPYYVKDGVATDTAKAQSEGTLWSLDLYYDQEAFSPADVRIEIDTVTVKYPGLSMTQTLSQPIWRQEVDYFQAFRIVRIGPIRVPDGFRSDIGIDFWLTIHNRCDSTIILTRDCHLVMKR